LEIINNCKILKQFGEYYISIVYTKDKSEFEDNPDSYCGIDPGVRDFMTVFGNDGYSTYNMNAGLKELNKDMYFMKKLRRIRRKAYFKRERKKENRVNQVHSDTVNDILSRYNTIFYGDIKSHDIVKKSNNSRLNKDFNDIKFYQFKQRLLNKALEVGKRVFLVNEAYTSKTCSSCGQVDKKLGSNKTYTCKNCDCVMDRDINAAKNIFMKGVISL
jgi:putative transposase